MHGSPSPGRAGADGAPTVHELQAFAVLAVELHFGRAARVLGVAQPSLSEAIRRLEARLGVVLFERTSRRVALTAAGDLLLPGVRRVLDDLATVRRAAALAAPPRRAHARAPASWAATALRAPAGGGPAGRPGEAVRPS